MAGPEAGRPARRVSRPLLTAEQEVKRDAAERCLWWWNLSMGAVHLAWAVLCVAISWERSRAEGFRIQAITTYPDWSGRGGAVPAIQLRHVVPFTVLTSGFAWISALARFLALALYPVYVRDMRAGANRFRWLDHAASSSLMIVLVSMLFGVCDAHTQFLIGSTNACMTFFGYAHELRNAHGVPVDWSNFIYGCFAGVCPWAVIWSFITFNIDEDIVPGFVWAILVAYILCFCGFLFNIILQYGRLVHWYHDEAGGFPGAAYYFSEKVYQVLSLLAKSLLLWIIVGGISPPRI